jgi:4-hydroxy-tetrahydrodipicolinate synthase
MSVTDGVLPPITTPFDAEGNVDHDALRSQIERLEDAGVHGIIPCGSTGERATLTRPEHERVIETATEAADTAVLAGTGASSTQTVIELTNHAAEVGADAGLVIYPYYSWPTNKNVVKHYETVADEVEIPIIIYNIPKRTGRNLKPPALERLAGHGNIVGIKESSGDINQVFEMLKRTRDMDFDVLAGYDSQALPILAAGGTGVTSVAANVYPSLICEHYEIASNLDVTEAVPLHDTILSVEEIMNLETIPVAVKEALAQLGVHKRHVRPPLYESDAEVKDAIEQYLEENPPKI